MLYLPCSLGKTDNPWLGHWIIGSLGHWIIGSLDHWIIGSLDYRIIGRYTNCFVSKKDSLK
ncbi:MAG: hypothetical protein WAP46_02315 [Dysgonamonadaceae bacterium]